MQKLDMINRMLGSVGENPVTDPESQHPSAIKARTTLSTTSALVQKMPWKFNTDEAILMAPNLQGEIALPENTLSFEPLGETSVVERGKRLYNAFTHTFVFTTGVYGNLRLHLAPEDCPEDIAQYIAAYSVWQFYLDDDGDGEKATTYMQERERMRIAARDYDIRIRRLNVNNKPEVARLMSRVRPASGYVSTGNPIWPGGR